MLAMQQMGKGVTAANIDAQYDLESVDDARTMTKKNAADCVW